MGKKTKIIIADKIEIPETLFYLGFMIFNSLILICIVLTILFSEFQKGSWINRVNGSSMEPTLTDRQFIYTDTSLDEPKRGSIILLSYTDIITKEESILVKRVIGLPDEYVEITPEGIFINDTLYMETYLPKEQQHCSYRKGLVNKIQLDENSYYVMGDNRGDSFDSRFFGPVQSESILSIQSESFSKNFYKKSIVLVSILLLTVFGILVLNYIYETFIICLKVHKKRNYKRKRHR